MTKDDNLALDLQILSEAHETISEIQLQLISHGVSHSNLTEVNRLLRTSLQILKEDNHLPRQLKHFDFKNDFSQDFQNDGLKRKKRQTKE